MQEMVFQVQVCEHQISNKVFLEKRIDKRKTKSEKRKAKREKQKAKRKREKNRERNEII
jgi:hypothetical protein